MGMDQRYTVFISEGELSFVEGTSDQTNSEHVFHDPSIGELERLIKKLENRELKTVQVSGDSKANWKRFKSFYKNIEAAGGLVQNGDGNFLFIYRLGNWDLPKGKLEKGESVKEGAVREVEEECGISGVQITCHIIDTYHTYPLKGKRILKRTYWYAMNYSGEEALIPQGEEGITEAVWLNSDKASEALKDSYASIARVWENH